MFYVHAASPMFLTLISHPFRKPLAKYFHLLARSDCLHVMADSISHFGVGVADG